MRARGLSAKAAQDFCTYVGELMDMELKDPQQQQALELLVDKPAGCAYVKACAVTMAARLDVEGRHDVFHAAWHMFVDWVTGAPGIPDSESA